MAGVGCERPRPPAVPRRLLVAEVPGRPPAAPDRSGVGGVGSVQGRGGW
jgi:hypothetical protein